MSCSVRVCVCVCLFEWGYAESHAAQPMRSVTSVWVTVLRRLLTLCSTVVYLGCDVTFDQWGHINSCSKLPFFFFHLFMEVSDFCVLLKLLRLQASRRSLPLRSAPPVFSVCLSKRLSAVALCLGLLHGCALSCFFVSECLKLSVTFGPKWRLTFSPPVFLLLLFFNSFTPNEQVDMGTISCTISHLSKLSFFLLYILWWSIYFFVLMFSFAPVMCLSELTSRSLVCFVFLGFFGFFVFFFTKSSRSAGMKQHSAGSDVKNVTCIDL